MEKLFLLELLVENVEIDYQKLGIDKSILDSAKQLCVKFQFLSFPELIICEEDFSHTEGDYQKNVVNIKSGKSCLFSIRKWNAEDKSLPLTVTVLRQNPNPPHLTIGKACINLGSSFTNILAAAQSPENTATITKKCADVYLLTNNNGIDIGKIRMFVRLTCFGPLIVTQFQISGDENNSFLFRGNDISGIVTYNRNNSGEILEKVDPTSSKGEQLGSAGWPPSPSPGSPFSPGGTMNTRPPECTPCTPCSYDMFQQPNAIPGKGQAMMHGGMQEMRPCGQGIDHSAGQGMVPGGSQGVVSGVGQGMMPGGGQGMFSSGGQGMMPGGGQGMFSSGGQGMMPGGGQGMFSSGGQGMMPGGGQGMFSSGGQGMMPGGGQGMFSSGGQGMMPGVCQGMMPGGGQGMMFGGGQGMVPGSGQGFLPSGGQGMVPAMIGMGDQNKLDYKEFGAEVNGHSLSIKVLRKPRKPKKPSAPISPFCGHVPIRNESSSSSTEDDNQVTSQLQPGMQICDCDFPLPPGFPTSGYASSPVSKKKKKKKVKEVKVKCPLRSGDYSVKPNSPMGYQAFPNMQSGNKAWPKTVEIRDQDVTRNEGFRQPGNKQVGMLGDLPTLQKPYARTPDEQLHTSGKPTFILNVPPTVFPIQDQPLQTPFQAHQKSNKQKIFQENSTQYNDKDATTNKPALVVEETTKNDFNNPQIKSLKINKGGKKQ